MLKKINIVYSLLYGFILSGLFVMGFMMIVILSFPADSTHFEYIFTKFIWFVLFFFLIICLVSNIVYLKNNHFSEEKFAKIKSFIYTILCGLIFAIPFYFLWVLITEHIYT